VVTYEEAKSKLQSFRSKILNDMVGARVKAMLDARHDAMLKYKNVIQNLDIKYGLLMNINRYLLQFKINSKDLGQGLHAEASVNYTGDLTFYPSSSPFNVERRELPTVDIFRFTPRTGIETLEYAFAGHQSAAFVIETKGHGIFAEQPDVSNALNDYYYLYPQFRQHGKWEMTGVVTIIGVRGNLKVKYIFGELLRLSRLLTDAETGEHKLLGVNVWVESTGEDDTGNRFYVLTVFRGVSFSELSGKGNYCVLGKRVTFDNSRVYSVYSALETYPPTLVVGEGINEIPGEPPVEVWRNKFKVHVQVNDETMGTTTPEPGEYTQDASSEFSVTATPYTGYKLDYWEVDGVNWGDTNPISVIIDKDKTIKAVFTEV